METKYKKLVNKITYTVLGTILLGNIAQAAILHIKNDDSAEVDITIEAGDGKILSHGEETIRLILKEGEEKTVDVKKSQLKKDTFSVTGKVAIPSLYNKCGPLLVDRNYKIIFTGSKTGGTICISELEKLN